MIGKWTFGIGCPTEQVLAEYADGNLAGGDRQAVERHLSRCDLCLNQVSFLVKTPVAPPETVPVELIRRAQALPVRRPRKFSLPRQWAAAAAVLVLCIATTIALKPGRNAAVNSLPHSDRAAESAPSVPAIAASGSSEENTRSIRNANVPDHLGLLSPQPGDTVSFSDLE